MISQPTEISPTTKPVLTTLRDEIHTSDLTGSCLRQVQLKVEGKAYGETTGALYVGNVVHPALAWLHNHDRWDRSACEAAVLHGVKVCEAEAKQENRPLSPSVKEKRSDYMAESLELVVLYAQRLKPARDETIIGTEIPLRFTLEHESLDEPHEFATHIDLLGRNRDGVLVIDDWKTGKESPSFSYLSRNMQLALMWLGLLDGEILEPTLGTWERLGERAIVQWIHIRSLKPYSKGGNGFKKGDARPLEKIRFAVGFVHEQRIRDELALRVRMVRAGHFPTNPDAIGCMLCDCKAACPSFDDYKREG